MKQTTPAFLVRIWYIYIYRYGYIVDVERRWTNGEQASLPGQCEEGLELCGNIWTLSRVESWIEIVPDIIGINFNGRRIWTFYSAFWITPKKTGQGFSETQKQERYLRRLPPKKGGDRGRPTPLPAQSFWDGKPPPKYEGPPALYLV